MKPLLGPHANEPDKPLLVTIDTAARLLSVRKRAIWEWILDGTLPSVVLDGERLVVFADLEAKIRDVGYRLEEILRGQPQPDPFK